MGRQCLVSVRCAGRKTKAELRKIYWESDVLVLPSLVDTFGFVAMEAMACGLPVIACSGSGVSELLVDRENGFLVPPNDLDALVMRLRELLFDSEKRDAMGARARQKILTEANSDLCMKRLEDFYAAVAFGKDMAAQVACA